MRYSIGCYLNALALLGHLHKMFHFPSLYSNFFGEILVVKPFQIDTEDVVCSFVLLLCIL